MAGVVFHLLLLFFVNAIARYVSPISPYEDGGLNVTNFSSFRQPSKDLEWFVQVYVPDLKETFGVILFLPGLDGNVPAFAYSKVLTRIASHGFIIAGFTALPANPITFEKLAQEMADNILWATKNLNTLLAQKKLLAQVDPTSIVLMGHSAGCKIVVKVFEDACYAGAKSLVLLNPVDGLDPWGIIHSYVITPGQKVNYTTPTILLGTGLGPIPGHNVSNLFPPCAPYNLSYNRFYDASNCPKWGLNATEYGHADLLDPEFYIIIKETKFCATNPNGDFDAYRNWVAGTVNSMLIGVVQQNCTALDYIQKQALIPSKIKTVIKYDNSCATCPTQFCKQQ